MKKQDILMLLTGVVFVLIFFGLKINADSVFHNQLNEWMELYRKHLMEDGINAAQISTLLNIAKSSAETTYSSLSNLYSTVLFALISFVVALTWRVNNLGKQLKEIKNKIDV